MNGWADHTPTNYAYTATTARNAPYTVKVDAHPNFEKLTRTANADAQIASHLNDLLNGFLTHSLAAIALDNQKIAFEKYRQGPEQNPYPAWSVTKGVTSLLVGYAHCAGHIKSLDDKASDYAHMLKETVWGNSRISNLLKMKSGAPLQGSFAAGGDYRAPTSVGQMMLSGTADVVSLFRHLENVGPKGVEGRSLNYNSFDTLALALVIESATKKSLVEFYKDSLWSDLKPEHPTYWFLDKDQKPLADGYFFMSLRDAARLGNLMLQIHRGEVGGECLRNYLELATDPHTHFKQTRGGHNQYIGYGFQLLIEVSFNKTVRLSGHKGQEIMVNFTTGRVAAIFSANDSIRSRMYRPDGVLKWLADW